jgi:hypothetical protein
MSDLRFDYSHSINEKLGESKTIIIDVLDDPELGKTHDGEESIPLEVSKRYCTKCRLEQPIRSKHCKECNKWVATHDHHCPWVGSWIGEKNRLKFFMFIWTQFFTIIYGFVYWCCAYASSDSKSVVVFFYMMVIYLCQIFFILMMLSLVICHTYLASVNMTTWEMLSWQTISYMELWPMKYGSPFNKGLKENFRLYFWYSLKSHEVIDWKFPHKLPTLGEGEVLMKNSPVARLISKYCD